MPRLYNPTGRKTEAHIFLDDDGNEFFFSYQTCIGYCGTGNDGFYISIRRINTWGHTTGRHFKEMACGGFTPLSAEEFAAKLPTVQVVLD